MPWESPVRMVIQEPDPGVQMVLHIGMTANRDSDSIQNHPQCDHKWGGHKCISHSQMVQVVGYSYTI